MVTSRLTSTRRRASRREPVDRLTLTMAGSSSRPTIAAWQVTPPPSVTSAAARRIVGTQSGLVMGATSTSPAASRAPSAGERRMRTGPAATPGAAARPETRSVPGGSSSVPVAVSPSVVMGRDCTIHTRWPSIANSTSCGAP
jgi:hypothetical protein